MCREKMYTSIDENGLNHEDTIAASQELDQEVLEEMLKDPIVENIYLKQVIKAKDYRIEHLENIIKDFSRRERRVKDLAEVAAMKHEAGLKAKDAITLVVTIAASEESVL